MRFHFTVDVLDWFSPTDSQSKLSFNPHIRKEIDPGLSQGKQCEMDTVDETVLFYQ